MPTRISVEKVIATDPIEETVLVQYITSLSQYSEHPLAEAIVNYGKSKNVSIIKINDFEAIAGKGVIGTVGNKKVALGNAKLLEQFTITIPESLVNKVIAEQEQGKTVCLREYATLSFLQEKRGLVVLPGPNRFLNHSFSLQYSL